MTRSVRFLALLAAAGGAAWLVKFAVIVATDGAENGAADTATAILYVLGAVLMAIGAIAVTLRFAAGRGKAAAAAAIVAGPLLWFAISYVVLDPFAQAVAGDAGPNWLQDESAVLLAGAVWLAIGMVSSRSVDRTPANASLQMTS